MSEGQLQRAVVTLAHLLGYACAHFRPARTARSWRTAVAADGAGWPDLVLCGCPAGGRWRLLFRELKGDGGRLEPGQAAWIARLQAAGQDARVWTAAMWRDGTIEEDLRA